MKWIAMALSVAAAGVSAAGMDVQEFPADGIRRIELESEEGAVRVVASGTSVVQTEVTGPADGLCEITREVRGRTLVMRASSRSRKWWKPGGCRAGFSVRAPDHLPVKVAAGSGEIAVIRRKAEVLLSAGSGDIQVEDVSGGLEVRTGSGDVGGSAPSEAVEIKAGSGDVSLTGLLGSADVKTGSGKIRLEWGQAPQKGRASVKSGSGDLTFVFPRGTRLVSDVRTGSGDFVNELGETPEAAFKVAVKAGSADVAIRRAGL